MNELLLQYGVFFLANLALSWHCIGMCGPFVIAVAGRNRKGVLTRQGAYHAGKTTTYLVLGLGAGLLGVAIDRHAGQAFPVQSVLSWIAGGVLLLVALQLLGVFRRVPGLNRVISGERWAAACGKFDPSGSLGAALGLGLINGFMPCPLVIGALAAAVSAGSVLAGLGFMLALSLATVPALVLLALGANWVRGILNLKSVKITGAIVLIASAIAIMRPTDIIHAAMGHDHSSHAGHGHHGGAPATQPDDATCPHHQH